MGKNDDKKKETNNFGESILLTHLKELFGKVCPSVEQKRSVKVRKVIVTFL